VWLSVLAACTPGRSGTAREIGPEGGTLESADGRLRLVVPPGAVDVPTRFTIGAAPARPGALGATYELGPHGARFHAALEIEIAVEGDVGRATIASRVGTGWVALDGASRDRERSRVRGRTWHFSAVAATAAEETEYDILSYVLGDLCADGHTDRSGFLHGMAVFAAGAAVPPTDPRRSPTRSRTLARSPTRATPTSTETRSSTSRSTRRARSGAGRNGRSTTSTSTSSATTRGRVSTASTPAAPAGPT
jgi:hypothetical protein